MHPIMIHSEKAPKAIGPYAQAVRAGGFLFCSGQIPIDPATSELNLFNGDVAQQTGLVLKNISAVLAAEGLSLRDVVKTTIYLSDMKHFSAVNAVYASCFGDHRPARTTVAVGLPKGADVEIDVVAFCCAR